MKLCKDCHYFISAGMTALMCQSPKTFTAKMVGVPLTRCEKERNKPLDKGCGWSGQFFQPRSE